MQHARRWRYSVSVTALAAVLLTGPVLAAEEYGSPPSGEIPILYNDHTIYAKPDLLKESRVLAALVKDGQMYVPLRGMFEAMGATVTASADGRTITAVKTGVSVSVTLDKSEVVINGETRPLDVPPMMDDGVLLVPIRVISEALGAYVMWVPERHLVVVRYIPEPLPVAPPEPTPPPTIVPTPEPTIAPMPPQATPAPSPGPHGFIQAAWSHGSDYNEFSSGQYCHSYLIGGAYEFAHSPFAVKADFRHDVYVTTSNLTDVLSNQYTQFATIDGGVAFTPVFLAIQNSVDVRLEYRVAEPKIYVGVGYLTSSNNYGYPALSSYGFGVEKLPNLRSGVSFFGSAFYYPNASGTYTINNPASPNAGVSYRQSYQFLKYDVGLTLASAREPVYLYGGFSGDRYTVKQNAPIGQSHDGPYIGLGVKF